MLYDINSILSIQFYLNTSSSIKIFVECLTINFSSFQKGEVNLENVTHEEAVATLKTTQDHVFLIVAKPESAFPAPASSEASYSPQLCKFTSRINKDKIPYCSTKNYLSIEHSTKRTIGENSVSAGNFSTVSRSMNSAESKNASRFTRSDS